MTRKNPKILINPEEKDFIKVFDAPNKENIARFIIIEKDFYLVDAYNTQHPNIVQRICGHIEHKNIISGFVKLEGKKWKYYDYSVFSWNGRKIINRKPYGKQN